MKNKTLIAYLPFWTALLAGLFFISLNVTGKTFTFFPGDFIDGRFNNYLLEHAYRFFTGQVDSFWNAPFMFPEENVITYSDNLLGSAPFYSVFRLLGADRETAFQLWYLLVTALNYAACYLLLKRLFGNATAAACGAFIFAFSMALHSQMGHAQTFPRFAIPLAVLMLLKFKTALEPKYFLAALFFLAYQMYCGIYLGFLLAIPFLVMCCAIALVEREELKLKFRQKHWWLGMSVAGLLNLLFLLPLLVPYFERARQTGFYPYESVLSTIPTLGSYFFSWRGSLLWDRFSETCISYPAFWDHEIFAGACATFSFFAIVLLCFAGLFYKKLFTALKIGPELSLIFLTGILTFVLFLKVGDHSLYRIIFSIPGFGSMRALQRVINVELLFFATCFAFVIQLLTKSRSKLAPIVLMPLIALLVADNYIHEGFIHQRDKAEAQKRVEVLCEKIKALPKRSIVSYEPDTLMSAPMDYQLDAMLATQTLNYVTLNGYTATSPGGYGPYWVKPNAENRKYWLDRKGFAGAQVSVIR